MASRRSLKKTVNYITELAAGLCLVESANANAEKREAYSEVFLQIINLRNDIISRISHTEPVIRSLQTMMAPTGISSSSNAA